MQDHPFALFWTKHDFCTACIRDFLFKAQVRHTPNIHEAVPECFFNSPEHSQNAPLIKRPEQLLLFRRCVYTVVLKAGTSCVTGGIITLEDLRSYLPELTENALQINIGEYKLHVPDAPSSGPVLGLILNILDGKYPLSNCTALVILPFSFILFEWRWLALHIISLSLFLSLCGND